MQFGIKYLGQIKTYLKGKDKLQNVCSYISAN